MLSNRQQAFVLVSTLWILTIMTIAASFFAVWTQRAIEQATALQTDVQAEIDQHSTLSSLLYILMTQRMTYAGVTTPHPERVRQINPEGSNPFDGTFGFAPVGNEIGLDDRIYHGFGESYFAIQDKRGLISINNPVTMIYADRLLQQLGIPDGERAPLLAKLQDYIDADDLYRINGAEAEQYEELDKVPPTNRPLRSPEEAYKILDWAKYPQLWDNNELGQISSTLGGGQPNLNTASAIALQTMPGIDANAAQRLIEFRRIHPLDNRERVFQALGLRIYLDELATAFMASDHLRITLWHKDSQRMHQVHIELTPFENKQKPWKTHYTLDLPLHSIYQNQDTLYAKTHLLPSALPTDQL